MYLSYETIDEQIGCIHLIGKLDIPGTHEVELKFTVLTSTQRKAVIVDLDQVDLITSIGLGLLITNAKTLKAMGQQMVLLSPKPNVDKVIRMSGLGQLLPIEYDLKAALEHILNT